MRDSIPKASALLLALVSAGIMCACTAHGAPSKSQSKPKPAVPNGGILLEGAGGTLPAILYDKWFSAYQSQFPGTVISYDAVGSSEGIRRFVGTNITPEEQVDFGASDAAMRDDELASVRSGAMLLPVTAASVALAYNLPQISTDLRLSREAYADIFLGKIKNWNDSRIAQSNPGVKFPKLTIAVVVRQDGSGTTFALTKHLDAINETWRAGFGAATLVAWPGNTMRALGNEGVAGTIQHSIGAIGYVSYEYALKSGLKVAWLENREGNFHPPTETHAAAALASAELPDNLRLFVPDPKGVDSYPIVTLTWVLLYRNYPDPQKAKALHDLFHWCLTDGQNYAASNGYIPLPPKIVARSIAALDGVRVAQQ
jgi:phosphate transport system substrate-binding protein